MPFSRENTGSLTAGSGARCVLLIDDEIVIRRALSRYFLRAGWVVVEAADGDGARRALTSGSGEGIDLVICDLRMPSESGEDFYRWLEEHRPELAERIVFSSGDVSSPEAVAFLARVRRPVLPKPFELHELARIVDDVRGHAPAS